MKTPYLVLALLISTQTGTAQADDATVNSLLQQYASQGATGASAEQGKALWQKTFAPNKDVADPSCASCHTNNLSQAGKHIKTNKLIEPMAPSVNPERLSDSKNIEKWFTRNCKWTIGRECTPQEKASFLLYINQ